MYVEFTFYFCWLEEWLVFSAINYVMLALGAVLYCDLAVFSSSKTQGMIGWCGVGEVCNHIKALGYPHSQHQREFYTESLLGRHALGMLGRTLLSVHACVVLINNIIIM